MIVNLEEPSTDGFYTGISNLRGWAVAESGIASIEIDVDGTYAFDVPMGGMRGDVAKVYPTFPTLIRQVSPWLITTRGSRQASMYLLLERFQGRRRRYRQRDREG